MKRVLFCIAALTIITCQTSFGKDMKVEDPNQLFYTGNHYYQTQDYIKAVEEYVKLLETGVESGNLYYNLGNGFLKLGKVGYAILCYEKARRFIPQDSDLKANLTYARSLIDETAAEDMHSRLLVRAIRKMYADLSLGSIAIFTLAAYLIFMTLLALFVFNLTARRRLGFIAVLLGVYLMMNSVAFAVRYYGEVILKHGVIVQKEAVAKYEPIDKSTTFYTLGEGNGVIILKTKEGWRQIKRLDGKTGWIKKEAAEEI